MKNLPEWNRQRKHLAEIYIEHLKDLPIILPKVADNCESVWHLFVIRAEKRNQLSQYLKARGIETVIHYPIPPHKQECYQSFSHYYLPIADKLSSEVLSLPLFPWMTNDEISFVCESISSFYKSH